MKFLKRNANVILICLFEVLIGILLLVDPIGFTSAIIIAFGVLSPPLGISELMRSRPRLEGHWQKALRCFWRALFACFSPRGSLLLFRCLPFFTV